jgi:hypothetical protein
MNTYTPTVIAGVIIEDRLREAKKHRLELEFRRREQATAVDTAVQTPRHHSRLWSLVHFRQAYT